MPQVQTDQDFSARSAAEEAGIQHGSRVDADVIVGLTPEFVGRREVVHAHFCSASIKVEQVLEHGNGAIPDDSPVTMPNGFPVLLDGPVMARFTARTISNGTLRFCMPHKVRILRIPEGCQSRRPWATRRGPQEVADALGCRDIEEAMDKHGELVST